MAYITPVLDRTLLDISNKNSKAYINVADWQRIYGNSQEVHLLFTNLGIVITFTTVAGVTTESIPYASFVNSMLANIERMRLYIATNMPGSITDPLFVEVKDDWGDGLGSSAPNFTHANSWEKVLDLMYQEVKDYKRTRFARTGVAGTGQSLTRQNRWRG